MVKLFAIIQKMDLEAVLAKKTKLSSVLTDEWENGGVTRELLASPQVPRDSKTASIELSLGGNIDLSQYLIVVMDGPEYYQLPIALVDQGAIRVLSDTEIMVAARKTIQSCMLPSPELLWHWIRDTPKHNRQARYGPYLTKAFDELTPKKEN